MMRHPLHAPFLIVATTLVLLSGCDSLTDGSGESIFLNTTIEDICFELSSISNGQSVSVGAVAADAIDIGPFLDQQNFSKSDVVGAQVTSVRLRMIFPIQESLASIRDVTVRLSSTSGGGTAVASLSTFSDSRSANLETNGASVSSIVSGTSFQAILDLTGASNISEDVVIEAEIAIQVEVAGL